MKNNPALASIILSLISFILIMIFAVYFDSMLIIYVLILIPMSLSAASIVLSIKNLIKKQKSAQSIIIITTAIPYTLIVSAIVIFTFLFFISA